MSFKTGAKDFLSDSKAYIDKLIKTLTDSLNAHKDDKNNPHGVTAEQVDAYTKTKTDEKLALKQDSLSSFEKYLLSENNLNLVSSNKFYALTDSENKIKKIVYVSNSANFNNLKDSVCEIFRVSSNSDNELLKVILVDNPTFLETANQVGFSVNHYVPKKELIYTSDLIMKVSFGVPVGATMRVFGILEKVEIV